MIASNTVYIDCNTLSRYIKSMTVEESRDAKLEAHRRQRNIERRFRVERRVCKQALPWGDLRRNGRRLAAKG